jgi:TonB-linked SusC/RagA family outer membrane protein
MKKILRLCFIALLAMVSHELWAQERLITGKVTSAEDGTPIPGVNVVLKGTINGTVTTVDGTYSISSPIESGLLIFTFIGLKAQEIAIGARTTVDVQMQVDAQQLSEVVVTALGIERNKNELAYAAQTVTGDQIAQVRSNNFVTSLVGRVAGLDVKQTNAMGGATNVVIRGYKSITGNNQALFVVDGVPVTNATTNTGAGGTGGRDYGNASSDINPDNIASINVLKGAAATALYGSRAANGVIMITTKKGKKNSFDVVINSGVTMGQINKDTYPKYQKEYGAGYEDYFYTATFDDGTLNATRFDDDASYGHVFDGQSVYQWDALDPFSPNYHKATPWLAAKNDPTTFFEKAVTSNQSIVVSGGGDKSTYKFGYTRTDEKGALPNSKLDKNMFSFSSSLELTKKLTVATSVNFTNQEGLGRYGTGYSGLNQNEAFRQWWQINVDIKDQKAAYFRNRKNVTWNWASLAGTGPIFTDNPYWIRYENYNNDTRNHIQGYTSVNYKIADWLDVLGRVAYDGTNDFQEDRIAVGSASTASYSRFNRDFHETNFDFMLNLNKKFGDISLRGVIGSNMRRSKLASIRQATASGLVVPRLYSISNSAGALSPATEDFQRVGVDGYFANATLGYKDLLYLDIAGRRDQSTTLPVGHNIYYYPSVGLTFNYASILKAPWLSSGKLRGNYAQVGNDAPALSLYNVYDKPTAFGTVPIFSLPNVKNNNVLKPERTKSIEAGLEAEFLDGRVGFDFTVYKTNTFDQILPVTVTAATGYTGRFVNSGEMENKGIEVSAFVTPVDRGPLSWTVNFNFTKNVNKVIYLYGEGAGEVTNIPTLSPQGGITLNAAKGQPYGVIKGYDYVYTNGQPTVNPSGYYLRSASATSIIGNPNPDWLGGINNTLRYKGLAFNFLVDIRHGGDIFSLDQWYGEATGMYPESAGVNANGVRTRLPVAEGGGILLPGVQPDGSPNTVYGENLDGNGATPFGYVAGGTGAPHKMYVYDGGYIKLREVAITYSLPETIVSKLKAFKGIDISLIGRNLWIIDKNMKYSDPEESLSSGNTNMGYQSGAYPGMKNYGFNVKLKF